MKTMFSFKKIFFSLSCSTCLIFVTYRLSGVQKKKKKPETTLKIWNFCSKCGVECMLTLNQRKSIPNAKYSEIQIFN